MEVGNFVYGDGPRVIRIVDRYYVTWCNYYHGPTIGVGWTREFEKFHQLENAFFPFNRNNVCFFHENELAETSNARCGVPEP